MCVQFGVRKAQIFGCGCEKRRYKLCFSLNRPTGPIQSQSCDIRLSVCLFVCLFAPSDAFFLGLSLALRSHDQFPGPHWSSFPPSLTFSIPPWELGNLATWKLGNSETWKLRNLETWKPPQKNEIKNQKINKSKKNLKTKNYLCPFLSVLVLVLLSILFNRFSVSRMRNFSL